MQDMSVSEGDIALVHALEVNPRATWSLLGEVLGVTPMTVARRWAKLFDQGAAWIAVLPGPVAWHSFAMIGINCASPRIDDVAATIAQDPLAITVEVTAGRYDLLVAVLAPDMATLSWYITDRLNRIQYITSTTSAIATEVFSEGSQWRIGAISRNQEHDLAPSSTGIRPTTPDVSDVDRELINALSYDGRMSFGDLASRIDRNASTVMRRLDRLLKHGLVTLRCEIASSLSGWPLHASLQFRVSPQHLGEVGRELAKWPEVRMCVALAAERNLMVSIWIRNTSELTLFEMKVLREFPHVIVVDRTLDLRVMKRTGHMLDEAGRSIGVVPIDLWSQVQPRQVR